MKKTNNGTQKSTPVTQPSEQVSTEENNDSHEPFAELFRAHLLSEGKTYSTIKSYTGDIEVFIKYLEDIGIHFTGQLERYHITSYRDFLIDQNVRAATLNTKINSLQSFNKFLQKNNITKDMVVVLSEDKTTNIALAEIRKHSGLQAAINQDIQPNTGATGTTTLSHTKQKRSKKEASK